MNLLSSEKPKERNLNPEELMNIAKITDQKTFFYKLWSNPRTILENNNL
jgi:hypothetical protein